MIGHLLRLGAWATFGLIILATIAPIGLRPADALSVDIDRALAFLVATALFVGAYPRHALLSGILMIASSGFIELLQFLSPTRHAHVEDALVKASGAAAGLAIGLAANGLRRRWAL